MQVYRNMCLLDWAASVSWSTDYNQAAEDWWWLQPLSGSSGLCSRHPSILKRLVFCGCESEFLWYSQKLSKDFFINMVLLDCPLFIYNNKKGERQSTFCMQLYRHSQTNTDSYSRTSGHSGNARLSPAAYCWAGLFVCVGWIIDIFRASLYIHVLYWAYLWHCLQLSVTWFKSCSHAANANANFTSLIG